MVKIILEREICIGCGACEAVCPKYWQMADDAKTILLGSKKEDKYEVLELEEVFCNQDAADSCPVQCITIK